MEQRPTWVFMAYKTQEDAERNNPYFQFQINVMVELKRLQRELEKAKNLYLWLREIPADQYGGNNYEGDLHNARKKMEFIELEIDNLKTSVEPIPI